MTAPEHAPDGHPPLAIVVAMTAAGVIGASPGLQGIDLQLPVNARGRLQSEEEFGDIIVRTGTDGAVTRLRDLGRIELGASDYALRSLLDNKDAVAIPIFQAPGSNAIQISDHVRETMQQLKQHMPEGVDYEIVYDPTSLVIGSMRLDGLPQARGGPRAVEFELLDEQALPPGYFSHTFHSDPAQPVIEDH